MVLRTLAVSVLALCALVLSLDMPAGAASRITEDFADLVKRAPLVVEVEITASKDEQNTQVGMPLTLSQAKVVRVLRGDAHAALVIERFGGNNGAERVHVPGQAQLTTGDRAVLLLIPSPLNNGRYRVLGGDAGCVLSEDSDRGARQLRRVTGRFDYYIADEKSLSGFVAKQAPALDGDEFDALVDAVLKTGRPVLTAAPGASSAQSAAEPVQLPVLRASTQAVSAAPAAPVDAPLFFKLGVFLASVTLAWAATRLARKLNPARSSK